MSDKKSSAKSTESQLTSKEEGTVKEENLGKTSSVSNQEAQEAVAGGPDKIKCNTTTSCDTTIPWGQ